MSDPRPDETSDPTAGGAPGADAGDTPNPTRERIRLTQLSTKSG